MLPREIVGAIAVDFFCGKRWRRLQLGAAEGADRHLDVRRRQLADPREGFEASTACPARSKVVVLTPSSMSASYAFSALDRNCARRVALPSTSGSTPDANGSS